MTDMNFKFTALKTIASLITGLTLGFYGGRARSIGSNAVRYDSLPIILIFIGVFIVIYSTWSLIQKKK